MIRRDLFALALAAVLLPLPASLPRSMSIALLFDVSFSVTPKQLASESSFEEVIRAVTKQFQPGDSAVIGLVASRVAFGPANRSSAKDLTADWRQLLVAPPSERFGPSPLFDALDAGVSRVHALPGARAVVLWTDGRPTGNVLGAEDAGARAATAGVSLNVIVDDKTWRIDPRRGPLGIERACQVFDTMARMTGGVCLVNSRGTSATVKQLERVLEQLRNR